MKNNKASRARSQKQTFVTQSDGTEVLKSKESRQKSRRWLFEADVTLIMAAHTKEDGTDVPTRVLPQRTLRLEAVSYGTVTEAHLDCVRHEDYLRASNPMFANSIMRVRALPKETVSNETIRQIQGYRDMSFILDKALELAIDGDGSVAILPTKEAKEFYYKRALELLRPEVKELQDGIREDNSKPSKQHDQALQSYCVSESGQDAASSAPAIVPSSDFDDEEDRHFVPEIVTIERASD